MSFFIARVRRFARRWKPTSRLPANEPAADLTCRELVELVTAYFEQSLPENERLRFEAHLAVCEGCTRYLRQMRETIRLSGTLREEHVTPEARERLLGAFRRWSSGAPGLPPAPPSAPD